MAESPDRAGRTGPEFLVLGLGNPGARYESARHNLGFLVVDAAARAGRVELGRGPGPYGFSSLSLGGRPGILAKPTTYMNRSGIAARALLDRFARIPLARFLVVFDDVDLPLGRIRFRPRGSGGGHNGLRSVIEELGSSDFPRLRLGIGRPESDDSGELIDHVLDPFRPEEKESVEEMVARGVDGIGLFVLDGIDAAMSRFNAG